MKSVPIFTPKGEAAAKKVIRGKSPAFIPIISGGDLGVIPQDLTLKPMKNLLILILLICIRFSASAQVAISVDKMNVVYVGLENPISIEVSGVKSCDLIVEAKGGIIHGSNGNYTVSPYDSITLKEFTINVSYKEGIKIKPAGSKTFRIRRVPRPTVLLGTLNSGAYSKVQMSVQKVVQATLENFTYEGVKATVTEFEIILEDSCFILNHHNTGQLMDKTSEAIIEKAKDGDKLYLRSVKYNLLGQKDLIGQNAAFYFNWEGSWYISSTGNFMTDTFTYYSNTKTNKYKISEEIYSGGRVIKETNYVQNGDAALVKIPGNPGVMKLFYPDGKLKAVCIIRDSINMMDAYTSEEIFPMEGDSIPDPMLYKKVVNPIPLTGEWKYFYNNGQIKSTGSYDGQCPYISGDSRIPDPKKIAFDGLTARTGIWQFFSPKGKLEKEITYKDGEIISRKNY